MRKSLCRKGIFVWKPPILQIVENPKRLLDLRPISHFFTILRKNSPCGKRCGKFQFPKISFQERKVKRCVSLFHIFSSRFPVVLNSENKNSTSKKSYDIRDFKFPTVSPTPITSTTTIIYHSIFLSLRFAKEKPKIKIHSKGLNPL